MSVGSCDSFVFLRSDEGGDTIFAKNSDRISTEMQTVTYFGRKKYDVFTPTEDSGDTDSQSESAEEEEEGEEEDEKKKIEVKCTYFSIPQVEETYAILISQPTWIWGAEHGVNEFGVCIGNEAVFSREEIETKDCLLGMDVVRLGLERGKSAKDSLEVMIQMTENYDIGGSGANTFNFYYHNSYLITDAKEAYVLETAGKHWVVEKVEKWRHITNNFTVNNGIRMSKGVLEKYWKDEDPKEFSWRESLTERKFWGHENRNYAKYFLRHPHHLFSKICSCVNAMMINREEEVEKWMKKTSEKMKNQKTLEKSKNIKIEDILSILKSHDRGICMHNIFITSGSMFALLRTDSKGETRVIPFFTLTPHPCVSIYLPYVFHEDMNRYRRRRLSLWRLVKAKANSIDKSFVNRIQLECIKKTIQVHDLADSTSEKHTEFTSAMKQEFIKKNIEAIHDEYLKKFEIHSLLAKQKKNSFKRLLEFIIVAFIGYYVLRKFI